MKKKILKFFPYIFCVLGIFFSALIWDHLALPYDENNLIQGTAFNKKLNPYNNTVRVLFFILFPISIFLLSFLYVKKTKILSLNPFDKDFFLSQNLNQDLQEKNYIIKQINLVSVIILFFLLLEFFTLDFSLLLVPIDIYHDGLTLVPSLIYEKYKSFWSSIHFDYGIGGNLRPFFLWNFLEIKSIGSLRFLDQLINLIIKIVLLILCRKISLIFYGRNNFALFYFLILSLSITSLINYFESLTSTGGSEFPLRILLFLIFFNFLLNSINKNIINYKSKIYNILLGLFSALSFTWFVDFAIYLNIVLIFYILILLFLNKYYHFKIILLSTILSWLIFISFFGVEETKEMFFQIKSNLSFIYYFNFLEFPKPFSDHYASSRALKILILIIVNIIICIKICLEKKFNLSTQKKLTFIFLIISSIIIFKSALIRSDTYHLKYTSGFIILLFLTQIYFLIFYYLKKLFPSFENLIFNKKKLNGIIFILILFLVLTKDINFIKIKNNFEKGIKEVFLKEDNYFLNFKPGMYNYGRRYNNNDYLEDRNFIDYYKKLTINDSCIQNFTEYLALAYFLNKPTCTKYYNAQFIQHGITDYLFLDEFEKNLPNYILYASPIFHIDKQGNIQQNELINGIPKVDTFIKKKYEFFENYLNKWVIFKKK